MTVAVEERRLRSLFERVPVAVLIFGLAIGVLLRGVVPVVLGDLARHIHSR